MNEAKRLTLGRDDAGRRRPRATRDWSGPCSISYDIDGDWPDPDAGDVLTTEAGRDYLILSARTVNSTVHPRRFMLDCERVSRAVANDARLAGAQVFPFRWYPR